MDLSASALYFDIWVLLQTKTLYPICSNQSPPAYRVAHVTSRILLSIWRSYLPEKGSDFWQRFIAINCFGSRLSPRRTRSRIFTNVFSTSIGPSVPSLSKDEYFTLHSLTSFCIPRCRLWQCWHMNNDYICALLTLGKFLNCFEKRTTDIVSTSAVILDLYTLHSSQRFHFRLETSNLFLWS